jgi:HD-GYP domain-containing protein (c-di-GMP phosphodiesterase class II)
VGDTNVAGPHCSCCDAPLGGPLRSREDPLCERCFLRRTPGIETLAGEPDESFVELLAETLDLREHEVGLHSRRVACHTLVLARRFSGDERRLRQIYWGALLHDLGKIGVPDRVLLKQGPLDDSEWAVMRRHPDDGYALVRRLPGMSEAAEIVRSHEECFDGSGYPRGLAGEQIPFGARLFAVIDTLDAMTSDRPYRSALPFDDARAEIVRAAGTQFDPVAVDALLAEEATLRRMVEIKCNEGELIATPAHFRAFPAGA